jgi:hypothetical protein
MIKKGKRIQSGHKEAKRGKLMLLVPGDEQEFKEPKG